MNRPYKSKLIGDFKSNGFFSPLMQFSDNYWYIYTHVLTITLLTESAMIRYDVFQLKGKKKKEKERQSMIIEFALLIGNDRKTVQVDQVNDLSEGKYRD